MQSMCSRHCTLIVCTRTDLKCCNLLGQQAPEGHQLAARRVQVGKAYAARCSKALNKKDAEALQVEGFERMEAVFAKGTLMLWVEVWEGPSQPHTGRQAGWLADWRPRNYQPLPMCAAQLPQTISPWRGM